jgi:peroxiredoxin
MKTISTILGLLSVLVAAASASSLPDLGQAPELIGSDWKNTDHAIKLSSLAGKVVVVHFWTLGCINCKHNLGDYNEWQKQFGGKNFEIIGIHTPESDYERSGRNLDESIQEHHIRYPVLVDNSSKNWERWKQQFWPAIYLIDKRGRIRDTWTGELEWNHAGGFYKISHEIEELERE